MKEITVNYLLNIEEGYARLLYAKDRTNNHVFIIGISDNKIDLNNCDPNELHADINEYVLGIRLSNYKQAEAYSTVFSDLAKKMKEEQNENEV